MDKNTKICKRCKIEKELSDFPFNKKNNNYNHKCKKCKYQISKNYHKNYHLTLKNTNPKKLKEQRKRAYDKRKNCPKRKAWNQKYYPKYYQTKIKTNKNKKIARSLRDRLRFSVSYKNQTKKSIKTIDLIGCNIPEIIAHLESLFLPEMNWDNYGFGQNKWVIDHILPCELFDLSNIEQQKICFKYTNLQPLWKKDNDKKSDYLPDGRRARHLTKEEKIDYLISKGFPIEKKPPEISEKSGDSELDIEFI